jgi:penicillin-binding protein 2
MPAAPARLRVTVVGVVVVALFAALFTRLWYLQVLDHPAFNEQAKRNEVRYVCEPAPRGRILDRNGTPLVENKVSTAVTLSQKEARDNPQTIPMLSALLAVPVEELTKRLNDPRYTQLKPVPIAVDVPVEKVIFIKENSDRFPGVDAAPLAQRRYPMDRLAAHLLGYTGPITQRELDARKTKPARLDGVVDPLADCDAYKLTDEIGKSGIESTYDEVLRGTPGVRAYEVDSKGKILRDTPLRVPVQGSDLVLTLDANIQKEAEDSLRQGLTAARLLKQSKIDPRFLHAPGGSAVVVDVKTGGIVAMASAPDFALDEFVGGVSKTVFGAYNDDPAKPLLNRPIQGLYPPASTFKLPVAVAGLHTGVIPSPGATIVDGGEYRIPAPCSGRCKYSNSGGVAHGRIDLPAALTVSSDVFFYDVGARFWFNRSSYGETAVQDLARTYGLGSKTGIALSDEHEGRVGDPKIRKRLSKTDNGWFVGDNVNMAIGQGETLVTPLQLAMEYATFANGGTLYQPRVVEQRREPDGRVAQDFGPIERGTTIVPPEHRGPILTGLRGVVANPAGTASNAFDGYSGMPVAGKTGTAQQPPKQDTALFVGFAPYTAPQYAVSVVLEEAGFGGTTAAPVARRIFEALSAVPLTDVHAADSAD